jgi:hypothetical protein
MIERFLLLIPTLLTSWFFKSEFPSGKTSDPKLPSGPKADIEFYSTFIRGLQFPTPNLKEGIASKRALPFPKSQDY